MPANIKQLLSELKKRLVRLYGEHLKAVRLFGSYARGESFSTHHKYAGVGLIRFQPSGPRS